MLIGLSLWRKNLVLSLTVFHSANYLIRVRRVLAGSAKKTVLFKVSEIQNHVWKQSRKSYGNSLWGGKNVPLLVFLGLNYFSNSKNKKGSCKHGNVMKNVCLCIYETKVWTISTLRNLFYKSYFAFVRFKKRIQKERVISYHVRKFPITCR